MPGDFRRFPFSTTQTGSLETACRIAKARDWRAFLRWVEAEPRAAALPGWGGRIRTSAWGNQNPLPYHLATPQLTCPENGGTVVSRILQATPVYRESPAISTA